MSFDWGTIASLRDELARFWFPTGERGYVPRIFQAASLVPRALDTTAKS